MSTRGFHVACLVVALLSAADVLASDTTPSIGQGATREQVIAALGPPTGQTKLGRTEILNYRNHQFRLENGRVVQISGKGMPPPPPPAPIAPTEKAAKSSPAQIKEAKSPMADVWITDFEEASRDAIRRNSAILTLFTSSDASPSSRQFQREIAFHPEFVNVLRARYVLLQIDAPVRGELPAELREQNEALRDRFGVRNFPALLILSAEGERLAAVGIPDAVPGSAFRSRLIATILAAYEPPVPAPPPTPLAVIAEPVAPPTPAASQIHVAPTEVTAGLTSARWLIMGAMAIGTLIAGVLLLILWTMIRKFNRPAVALNRRSTMASRIDHAASGLPSQAEIVGWPKEKICDVAARLAEVEGFVAEGQPRGSNKDLLLKYPGIPTPEVIVCCVTGNAGVMPTRRIKDLVGLLAAEDVPMGWFISPMGFSVEARAYAEQNNVRLIDGAALLQQLGDLPTFALPKVLASIR